MSSRSLLRALLAAPFALGLLACDDAEQSALGDAGGVDQADTGGPPPDGGADPDGSTNADSGIDPDAGFITVGEVNISRTEVDFGPVVRSTSAIATITITNPQDNAVRVSLSDPAGPDADAFTIELDVPREGASFELAPSAEATMTVTLQADDVKSYLATLALDSCMGDCPSSIVLIGEGVETGVVCPETAGVWVANPDTCVSDIITCENEGNATEQVSEVLLTEGATTTFQLGNVGLPADIGPGDTFDVELTFCPPALGEFEGTLQVSTDSPSQVSREVRLRGRGGGPDVVCTPENLDIGITAVGDTISALVRCSNRGDEDLELTGTLSGSSEISVSSSPSSPLAPATIGDFEISFSPGDLGAETATLEIATNDPDTPSITVSITAEAVDLLPCQVEAHPPSFDFGLVAIGDRRPFDLTLTNAGPTSCNLLGIAPSVTPSGAFDIQIPPMVSSLAPGASVVIPVEFAPTTNGPAMAEITASFSNPMSPNLVVMLSGEGGTPELQLTPFPVEFGGVAVGCAAPETRSVTIRQVAAGFSQVTDVQLITSSTSAFTLNAGPLPQNLGFLETLQVDITFTPPAVGTFSGELRVTSPSGTVSVPVTGQGQATSQRTDSKTFNRPPVDVLFVIDDSCSMGAAQAGLGAAMPSFVNSFATRGVDYQIGVVTTDMFDNTKSGRFQGNPTLINAATPNLLDQLSARMQPGIGGSGTEQGIRAAVTAVTPPLSGTANAGFLRANADLAVVWVSDEDDFSQGTLTVQDYLSALRQVAPQDLILAGITGPGTGNCQGPYGEGQAAPSYVALLSSHLNSLSLSYCADMTANLLAVSGLIFGSDVVNLSGTPVIDTLTVTVNGANVPRQASGGTINWGYDLSRNAIVFVDAAVVPSGATVNISYDAFCLSGSCGDGTTDPGEQCDDNNNNNDDTCINCTNAICGDGFTQSGVEQCDDGNLIETDACTSVCRAAACGDGFLQPGEECDDGNTVGGDSCPASCVYYQTSGLTSISFTELTTGTPLTFSGGGGNPNDDGIAQVVLPFEVSFFGNAPTSTLTVSVNGLLAFGPLDPADTVPNEGIPSANAPENIVAPWWDNLELDANIPGGADISWTVQGSAPNRVAVVQWRDIRRDSHSSFNHRRFTFQVQMEETTNIIRFMYGNTETRNGVPNRTTASVGIEGETPLGTLGYEPLGCSPECDGPPRPGNATGFPDQSMITFTP